MDAFYAAVEQRDHPEYRGKPIIVGGSPDARGVVATCSYEARRFGIRSAMPSSRARRLCPQAIFLKPRFPVYRRISQQIQKIFRGYTELIEPLSLDEAFLDVTGLDQFQGSATRTALAIRNQIHEETGLTASAGISYNKFLAKLASDMRKPNGQLVITPEQGQRFIEELPIGRFFGIGQATEKKMHALGVYSGADLKAWSREKLVHYFGKAGHSYYDIARAIDNRPVRPQRQRKSLGKETTFQTDLTDENTMLDSLRQLAVQLFETLRDKRLTAAAVTIKVKYADFRQVTRGITLQTPLRNKEQLQQLLPDLLARTDSDHRPVRLLGVSLSRLAPDASKEAEGQQDFFS